MDHEIGKVLDAVEELGIARDTLITFSSDNGGSVPHAATNEPWRGGKQEHWEGGIRVPTCAVWPGTIPVGQSDELGITIDLRLSHQAIAEAIGSTRVTITRLLGDLRQSGLVQIDRKKITVLDPIALAKRFS